MILTLKPVLWWGKWVAISEFIVVSTMTKNEPKIYFHPNIILTCDEHPSYESPSDSPLIHEAWSLDFDSLKTYKIGSNHVLLLTRIYNIRWETFISRTYLSKCHQHILTFWQVRTKLNCNSVSPTLPILIHFLKRRACCPSFIRCPHLRQRNAILQN